MDQFDYIVSGVGGAGLLLAEQLAASSFGSKRVLLLDPQADTARKRTWCFWTEDSTSWAHVITQRWNKLAVHTPEYSVFKDLGKYEYCLVQGKDYHQHVWQQLKACANIQYRPESVQDFQQDADGVVTQTDSNAYRAKWAFNSSHWAQDKQQLKQDNIFLWQHFEGWWIETESAAFETDTFTLMDFRTEQTGGVCFFYVLPVAENKALVELTVLSTDLPTFPNYQTAIEKYINQQLDISTYSVYKTEQGAIPMTNARFASNLSPNVFNIGTVGGAVKPSTGYTFMNSWAQAQAIVEGLVQADRPFLPKPKSSRFRFYDTLLLHILKNYPSQAATIFYQLFSKNAAQTVLTFLNEESTLLQEVQLFAGLPKELFLKALWETQRKSRKKENVHLNPLNPLA